MTSPPLDGAAGLAGLVGGKPKVVFDFTIAEGRVVAIDLHDDARSMPARDYIAFGSHGGDNWK